MARMANAPESRTNAAPRRDTPEVCAYIPRDGHRRRGVRTDLGAGTGPGGGLGCAVRGPVAARLQLLPLSGRRRRRGRGPDVAHVREGVGGAEPLPAGPGGVLHVA